MHEEDTKNPHGPHHPHGPRGTHGTHGSHGPHGMKGMMGCFPFSPEQMHKMKHMAKHFMRSFMGGQGSHIPHNIEDLGENYLITVPLAGRTKEDVKVALINNHLNIKAAKPKIPELEKVEEKPEGEVSNKNCCSPQFLKGFTFVDVDMDIPLPVDADVDSIVSKMANGLLKITVGKKPAKNIDISDN